MACGGGTNLDILSDEVYDFVCTVCKRKGKNCEAEKYCEECGDYFCVTCVKVHDDVPYLTGHTILGKEQFPNEPMPSSQVRPDAPTERCARHSHHFIDMYCQSHDEVGCGTCMAMDHRICKDIFYIPEYVENKRRITRSCEMEQNLRAVANSLTEHLENFKMKKEKLLVSKEATLELVYRFRKEVNERLDELETTTISDIASRYSSLVDIIDKEITMFQTNKDKIIVSLEVLSKSIESVTQKFVNIKQSKHLASKTIDFIEENKGCITTEYFDFSADSRILYLLNEMHAFGTIHQVTARTKHDTTQNVPSENPVIPCKIADIPSEKVCHTTKMTTQDVPCENPVIPKGIPYMQNEEAVHVTKKITTLGKVVHHATLGTGHKPRQDQTSGILDNNLDTTSKTPSYILNEEALHRTKKIKKYRINVKTDKFECSILTACTMNDGTIILAEGRNNKLKRLNGYTFALKDFCDMPGKPWQVCPINNDQVAVTLPRKEIVLIVSLSSEMKVINQIETNFNCHGLAYANGKLYISDKFTAIYVHSFLGEKMQKFTKDSPSKDMSYAIRSLAVMEDGSKVFVIGWNNGLIILNKRGKVVGRFNVPQLDGAWDCHLTGAGSLLVSGNNSNNVLQFGLDGKLKGEVVRFTDINGSYKGLCCNRQMTKMIIGKTGDDIEVYDLT